MKIKYLLLGNLISFVVAEVVVFDLVYCKTHNG